VIGELCAAREAYERLVDGSDDPAQLSLVPDLA
jgi:hypothetical protein